MRWNFGGNLQPVRMICEYDWKECPIAFMSYVWSEIVTDVVDGLTGEANLWRILIVVALSWMLCYTVFYKTKWFNCNKTADDFSRDHLIKVGFKVRDLELKINILTYKMQYGTWPLPHEISTPSLNDLKNVKLTLSNTSKRSMWTEHNLHGYISKCIENLETDKHQPINQDSDSKMKNKDSRDYERLIKTAKECRKYMDEIHRSNKSLGLCDNSSDISEQNSMKDIRGGTESEENNSRSFLIDPKKWQEIYNYRNNKTDEDVSCSDFTSSNQMFSTDDERYPLKTSKNKVRLLPPGLSITFLSDKFKNFALNDNNKKMKSSANETLNKAKEKLECLNDSRNSKSLNNVGAILADKKCSETCVTGEEIRPKNLKIDKLVSSDCESSSGDNGVTFNSKGIDVFSRKIDSKHTNPCQEITETTIHRSKYENSKSVKKMANGSLGNVTRSKNSLDFNLHPDIGRRMNLSSVKNLPNKSDKVTIPITILPKPSKREYNSSFESDSSTSYEMRLTGLNQSEEKSFNSNRDDNVEKLENNINLNLIKNKSFREIQMETNEDEILISESSSVAELSKDSDDKSTTTLLREALEFKKTLLMQIKKENEVREDKSSECESDETPRSRVDNHFRSKFLDIISEEQSACSSIEKTSKTHILSREMNGTNLYDESCCNFPNQNNNSKDPKSDKIIVAGAELKNVITTSSSEYFSINNVTDNEHSSMLKINPSVIDRDGLKNLQLVDTEVKLNEARNHVNNILTQEFHIEVKRAEANEGNKSTQDNACNSEFQNIMQQKSASQKVETKSLEDRSCNESREKMKCFASTSSVNSEKGILWNSISESSSTESIVQFVNALGKHESKTIDTITEEKLMMLNSTDYEGRNFATVGEDSRYNFNPRNKTNMSSVPISDLSSTERNNAVIEEVLEMIADSAIFKSEKTEINEHNSSGLFESNNVHNKLDSEKLQRKQDIFSKLKSLDAFTKPLDISECSSEKIDNEEETSPLTGRTVVYNYDGNETEDNDEITEKLFEAENIAVKMEKSGENDDSADKDRNSFTETDARNNYESSVNINSNDSSRDKKSLSKNMIQTPKKIQLSISSITNFSTDTSESYFDVSNHDFAVSSIILTSQNSNFVSNTNENCAASDTSSCYVDASDYSSRMRSDSSGSQIEIKDVEADIDESLKLESVIKSELLPKPTSSLPTNDKKNKLYDHRETLSSSNLIKENFKCFSNINLEKSYSKGRAMVSKSCIPILKSRIDGPKREKSIEYKARSRSPVQHSQAPTTQTMTSYGVIGNENPETEPTNRSRKSLNRKESYVLSPKNIAEGGESLTPRSIDNKECETLESVSEIHKNKLSATGRNLTKDCTVIYINIVSDSERNDKGVTESIKCVGEKDSIYDCNNLESKHKDLSEKDLETDKNNGNHNEIGLSSAPSESRTEQELWNNIEKMSEILSVTSDKLLSTSTLEISNSIRIEKREIEVSAKPSVKNMGTSISDLNKVSTEKQISFYDPTKEMFDVSKEFMKNDKIVLSEMIAATDPNFFECKKNHKLYNKLGLGFQE